MMWFTVCGRRELEYLLLASSYNEGFGGICMYVCMYVCMYAYAHLLAIASSNIASAQEVKLALMLSTHRCLLL